MVINKNHNKCTIVPQYGIWKYGWGVLFICKVCFIEFGFEKEQE